MKYEYIKYIIRNITRKKKQTFFTVLCISVSSFIILINTAQNNGIRLKLKEGINQAVSGQLTIYKAENPQINILESRLQDQEPFTWDYKMTELLIKAVDNISVNKRIRFGSLISYNEETSYLNIHALEKSHLLRISNLLYMNTKELPFNDGSILISKSVANDLNCNVGDTLLLVTDNINNYMSDDIAVVSGIFEEKGLATLLNYIGFVIYGFGEEIIRLDKDKCLELVVNSTANNDITKEGVTEIEHRLNNLNENISIASWEKTVPLFFKIVDIWKGGGYFTQALFIIFSLIILINLISLIINSRRKELGTLLATGFSLSKITVLICAEYLTITIFSVTVGCMSALMLITVIPETGIHIPSKDMQSALMTEYLHLTLFLKDITYTLLLFCAATFFASLISIARIKHLSPIELINKN